jgi:hypothetical protein
LRSWPFLRRVWRRIAASLLALAAITDTPAFAFDFTFEEPNVLNDFAFVMAPPSVVPGGINGSLGIAPYSDVGYQWSRLIERNQTFDTGLPCCVGDPVVPLSLMFHYYAPAVAAGTKLNGSFAKLGLYHDLGGSQSGIEASLDWFQSTPASPLTFRFDGESYAGSSGHGQIVPIDNLLDGHWYRLAASIGEGLTGNSFLMRLDDYGTNGLSFNSTLAESGFQNGGTKVGVNGTYAGFFGATYNGNGAVAFDEFHTTFGDFSANGNVDAADYTLWRDTYGTRDRRTNHSGDYIVDESDYQIWRDNFGRSALFHAVPSAASAITLPEPATLVLMILAAAGWCLRRGRAA